MDQKQSHVDEAEETLRSGGSESPESGGVPGQHEKIDYPKGLAFAILIISLSFAVFLMSLDRTIVSTGIPKITDEFHSYADVGWYGGAYLITACVFQPTFGRIYDIFSIRTTYLLSLLVFEVGSIVCATAQRSSTLIVGRAIAGAGSAGIFTGSFVVVAHSVPMRQRPMWTGIIGSFFGIGSVAGPLIGGAFTTLVSWRWVFWISLPIGGVIFVGMVLFFKPPQPKSQTKNFLQKVDHMDLPAGALLLGAVVMLILALEFVNEGIPWQDSTIIGLLVGSGATVVAFILWLWWRGENALIPLKYFTHRGIFFACMSTFFVYGTILVQVYYVPIWLQAIKNQTAVQSGVGMLAYIGPNALFSLLAGILVSKIGYFAPPAIVGSGIAIIGSGLLCTLKQDSSTGAWVGYLLVIGIGLGAAVQQGFIAVQAVLPLKDVGVGTALITFFQSLGGAIFISVGNTILIKVLSRNSFPGINVQEIIGGGATAFLAIPREELGPFLSAYNYALTCTFILAAALNGMAFLTSLGFEWRDVRKEHTTVQTDGARDGEK